MLGQMEEETLRCAEAAMVQLCMALLLSQDCLCAVDLGIVMEAPRQGMGSYSTQSKLICVCIYNTLKDEELLTWNLGSVCCCDCYGNLELVLCQKCDT